MVAALWSAAWLFIRDRTRAGLEGWIGREAAAGRRWSCADRTIGGYPFRIEVRCASFTLDRPDVHVSVGSLLFVSQAYQPRRVIVEASGPLQLTAGANRAEGGWRLLQASLSLVDDGFERLSLTVDEPSVTVESQDVGTVPLASRRFEAHLRPEPGRPHAFDLAMRSEAAMLPLLDELFGGKEPADLAVTLDVTEADDLPARPLWSELERWRVAGGRLDLTSFTLRKGTRRLEASGRFGIDEGHRPEGQVDARAANLGGLVGRLTAASNLTGVLGALLGAPPVPSAGRPSGDPALKPLPPLRLESGRLLVGPFPIPGLRIQPLY